MKKMCGELKPTVYDGDNNIRGFKVETSDYTYYLKCTPKQGHYDLYCYCYNTKLLTQYLKTQSMTDETVNKFSNTGIRLINLIAVYEDMMDIPNEERTTRYSDEWNLYIIKDENCFDKARQIVKETLKAIGVTAEDFSFDEVYGDIEFVKKRVEDAFRPILVLKDEYELVEIFNKPVLFTHAKLRSSDIPSDLFKYDIRHDDDGEGNMVELKNYVNVNHWGTVICKEPFNITQEIDGQVYTSGDGLTMTKDDYNYLGESITIDEYKKSYDELLQQQNEDVNCAPGDINMSM